jgi:DNA-binding transcriptional LysR family regulator
VTSLEEELGVALFERVGNTLELTQSGVQLLLHVRQMGESAMAFSLAARGQSEALKGSVVISVSEADAYFRLPPVIAKLRKIEPGIQLEIVVSNETSDLKRREADIALRSYRPTQPDLIARKLLEEKVWLYGSPEYAASLRGRHPRDIADLQIMGWGQGFQVLDLLNSLGWGLTSENLSIVTSNHLMQLALVRQGLGLSFFAEDIGDAIDGLERVFPQCGPPVELSLWLVSHRELRTSARVRRVYDLLAAELAVH